MDVAVLRLNSEWAADNNKMVIGLIKTLKIPDPERFKLKVLA